MSEPNLLARVPLFAMAVAVAGLTLAVVLLFADSAIRHWGDYRFALFAIPMVLAVVYLNEYRKLPYEPRRRPAVPPAPVGAPTVAGSPPAGEVPSAVDDSVAAPEERFEDPVEEADRLSSPAPPDPEAGSGPEETRR